MTYAVGVDIGGTKVAIAVVDQTSVIVEGTIIPTDLSIPPEDMIQQINVQVRSIIRKANIPENDLEGIGVGVPGPLDSREGIVTCPPNLPTWVDIPIQEIIERDLPYPVKLENDANAATLAEKWIGAGQENNNFIYMTVSTGIGAGVIADNKLLRGRKGNAGDFGHVVIDPSFGQCSCGQYGCLESIASGTAIANRGSEIMGKKLTTKEVFDLYTEGHTKVVHYIERVFQVLGVACVSLVNTFDTEKIVIGGGVSKVGESLFKAVRDYVRQYALNPTGRKTQIVPAKLEQNAGVIGAAALWLDTRIDI